jgi:lantibiotic modifying enzyme
MNDHTSQPEPGLVPLLAGAEAAAALAAAREIGAALAGRLAESSDSSVPAVDPGPSVSGGDAGLAIFFAYLAAAFPEEGHEDAAFTYLRRAMDGVGRSRLGPDLFGGFPGAGWTLAHLEGHLFDSGDRDPGASVEAVLLKLLERSEWTAEYDLISGCVGLGVWALERLPRPGARACLGHVVRHLGRLAERDVEGIRWFTPPNRLPAWQRELCPRGHYNLGLAHGIPGVIALLGHCAEQDLPEARPLLEGALEWLWRQRLFEGSASVFSSWTGPGVPAEPSRLAWCYGDLGVAVALLGAIRRAGLPGWETPVLELARSAARRSEENARVKDAGLCHGAAGNGHLFNRLYQATGEPIFGEAARRWLRYALELRRPGEGIAGFLAWRGLEPGVEWKPEPGLLEGAAGIGLALLAAGTEIPPDWDRLLLADLPPRC